MINWKSLNSEMNELATRSLTMLYMKEELSDVKLLVKDKRFPAHKCILAQRSNYFKILFNENKRRDEFELKDIRTEDFKLILQCIYGIIPNLINLDVKRALSLLKLSCSYSVKDMTMLATDVLEKSLHDFPGWKTFLAIFEVAVENSIESLQVLCTEQSSATSDMMISCKGFSLLSPKLVKHIISLDSLCVPEIKVFEAVQGWIKSNPSSDSKQEILDQVRLGRMSEDELIGKVWPSSLYPSDKILQALEQLKLHPGELGRGIIVKDTNLCQEQNLRVRKYSLTSLPRAFEKFQNEFMVMAFATTYFSNEYVIKSIEIKLHNRRPGRQIFIKLSYSNNVIDLKDLDNVEWMSMDVTSWSETVSVKKIIKATVVRYLRIAVYYNKGSPPRVEAIECKY